MEIFIAAFSLWKIMDSGVCIPRLYWFCLRLETSKITNNRKTASQRVTGNLSLTAIKNDICNLKRCAFKFKRIKLIFKKGSSN